MNTEIIDYRKFRSEVLREARSRAKIEKCFLCEQKGGPFCNSHLIPRFILKNISTDGNVLNFSRFALNFDFTDMECGLNKAGTFYNICRKCDNTYFSDYENEENIRNFTFSNRFLAQIIIKNFLSRLYKRSIDGLMPEIINEKKSIISNMGFIQNICNLDMRDYNEDLLRQRNIIERNLSKKHYIIFQQKLDYKVPFAVQAHISLHKNLNGDIINDVYCMDSTYKIRSLHLCIFPLVDKTIIILFIDKFSQKRYRSFIQSFNRLPIGEKLQYITYLSFKYTEDIFFSPLLPNSILENKELQLLSQEVYDKPCLGWNFLGEDEACYQYKPVDYHNIPNLLSREYCI